MLREPGQPLLPPLVEEEQQRQRYERTYDEKFLRGHPRYEEDSLEGLSNLGQRRLR
jgi:hypothetical protein